MKMKNIWRNNSKKTASSLKLTTNNINPQIVLALLNLTSSGKSSKKSAILSLAQIFNTIAFLSLAVWNLDLGNLRC